MRIFVTGGAGFIGSNLLLKLKDLGNETALFDDFNDFYDPAVKQANAGRTGAQVFRGDIRDAAALRQALDTFKPDAVVHLAARAGVRPSIQEPQLYVETNINGTVNLLEAMRGEGIKRLVFGSSSSVYGCNTKVPFAEEDPLEGCISPYAATKISGEQLCSSYAATLGLQIVALRFFTVYGPGQRPDLAIHRFTKMILAGEEIPQFGDGSTERDYTHVDDIVQGIIRALTYTQEKTYDVFNLGESRTVSLRELIQLIEKACGKPAKIKQLPHQPGDVPRTFASIAKAKKVLGYEPSVSIEDGITGFVEWFRRQQTP
jgi:UDP-glucuronate 4-epimerase